MDEIGDVTEAGTVEQTGCTCEVKIPHKPHKIEI